MSEYGARVYKRAGTIQIIQTIKRGTEQNAPYIVDRSGSKNKETFVRENDGDALANAIRRALAGELVA